MHNNISGKSQVRFGTTIQAITGYLREGVHTGTKVENAKQVREQETNKMMEAGYCFRQSTFYRVRNIVSGLPV